MAFGQNAVCMQQGVTRISRIDTNFNSAQSTRPERGHSCPQQLPNTRTLGMVQPIYLDLDVGRCCGQECPRSGLVDDSSLFTRAAQNPAEILARGAALGAGNGFGPA